MKDVNCHLKKSLKVGRDSGVVSTTDQRLRLEMVTKFIDVLYREAFSSLQRKL